MDYKILAIGDPHLKLSNLKNLRLLGDKLVALIRERRPNGVVILGDLHDSHDKMNVYAWLEEINFLDRVTGAITRMNDDWAKYLIGNHDIPSNNHFLEGIHPFRGMDGRVVVDKPEVVETPVGRFAFVPYVPNGRFKEALGMAKVMPYGSGSPLAPGPYRAIFCHQEFKDADFGSSIISRNGDEWPVDGDQIISGHIHKRQVLQGNIKYIGSPYQVSFGEDERKYVSLFTYTKDTVTEELIDLGMPRKETYTSDIKNLSELKISDQDDNRLIILDTSTNMAKFKQSTQFKDLQKIAKVIFKPTDKVFVKRDVSKKTFLDILREYVAKEDALVGEVFTEVLNATDS